MVTYIDRIHPKRLGSRLRLASRSCRSLQGQILLVKPIKFEGKNVGPKKASRDRVPGCDGRTARPKRALSSLKRVVFSPVRGLTSGKTHDMSEKFAFSSSVDQKTLGALQVRISHQQCPPQGPPLTPCASRVRNIRASTHSLKLN